MNVKDAEVLMGRNNTQQRTITAMFLLCVISQNISPQLNDVLLTSDKS